MRDLLLGTSASTYFKGKGLSLFPAYERQLIVSWVIEKKNTCITQKNIYIKKESEVGVKSVIFFILLKRIF